MIFFAITYVPRAENHLTISNTVIFSLFLSENYTYEKLKKLLTEKNRERKVNNTCVVYLWMHLLSNQTDIHTFFG